MIEIRRIDAQRKRDISLPNEPFSLFGRFEVRYQDGKWSHALKKFAPEDVREMRFPDENYGFDQMRDSVFLGAYENDQCVGLAILQPGFFKYMYLYDLKVCGAQRGQGIGKMLIQAAGAVARESGYRGLYTQGQDDNPGACLFYLSAGFEIGGLDTHVYRGTAQEGKADVLFYRDCVEGDHA